MAAPVKSTVKALSLLACRPLLRTNFTKGRFIKAKGPGKAALSDWSWCSASCMGSLRYSAAVSPPKDVLSALLTKSFGELTAAKYLRLPIHEAEHQLQSLRAAFIAPGACQL